MKINGDINQHNITGNIGEDIAVEYLLGKGYSILHRNWHFGHKEIDIVAKYKETLVIVEVKTRASNYWEEPKEAVKRKKQRRLVDAADAYVQSFNINADVRFDIVSVILQGQKQTIEHVEDAFYPTL